MLCFGNKKIGAQMEEQNVRGKQDWSRNSGNQLQNSLKQIYYCQCGKQYLSFPAVYLHFRSKHDIKLSTKSTERRRTERLDGSVKKITYLVRFFDQNSKSDPAIQDNEKMCLSSQKSETMNGQGENIQSCIKQYLKYYKKSFDALFQNLICFVNREQNGESRSMGGLKLQSLPYYLNDFAVNFLPSCKNPIDIESQEWRQSCNALKQFCDWLRLNKHTDLLVICETSNIE